MIEPMTAADESIIAAQLGRRPRAVVGVAHRCPCGKPAVVATRPRARGRHPVPDDVLPDLPAGQRGLLDPGVAGRHGRHGEPARLQDADLAAAYRRAHQAYLADRRRLGEVAQIAGVSAGGMPDRVKCLHALVAHALAAGPGVNPLGDEALAMIGEFWTRPCLTDQPVLGES